MEISGWHRNKLSRGPDAELVLEIGLLIFAVGLTSGIGALLIGRVAGRARHASLRRENPPAWGSIPPERQKNIATVAAR